MAVLAHPDDESLGFGGTLAKYASEGVDVSVLTATRGDAGRYRGHPPEHEAHPGARALAAIREGELRAAAAVLGVRELVLLDYHDQQLDSAAPRDVIDGIARHIRRIRPDVVLTFGADGAYGHPDHIAISQFATAAIVAAAAHAHDSDPGDPPHVVSKLYYLAWPASAWVAYEAAFRRLIFHRRRQRATGHALARMGPHYCDRYARLLAHGLAGDLVSRLAGDGVRAAA